MPWPVHPTGFLGSRGDNDTYRIERSLRFNSADSAYLNRTPSSAGNRKTWTWSGWVKRGKLGVHSAMFSCNDASGSGDGIGFANTDLLQLYTSGGTQIYLATSQVFRDPSAWYHIVASVDTAQSTASNRAKLYVNGVQVTALGTATYPTQNADTTNFNTATQHLIGSGYASLDGYLTEINFIDGQALTPSSFGETDSITNRWKAKKYSGTYGTNGFYLNFSDNSGTTATTLGKDSSGNGNNWTPNNFSVTAGAGNDSVFDVPTNYSDGSNGRGNYMTFNPLDLLSIGGSTSRNTLSDGNLKALTPITGYSASWSSFPIFTSGKFKFEAKVELVSAGSGNQTIGIADKPTGNFRVYWSHTAGIYSEGGSTSATGYTTGDVLTFEINRNAQTIVFYKNGTQILSTSFIPTTTSELFIVAYNGLTLNAGFSFNFGQQPFLYGSSGFGGLCTTNLPTPTIQNPSKAMNVITRNGTGTNGGSFTGLSFQPDFIWEKTRSTVGVHGLFDSVRGAGKYLQSNSTAAETTDNNWISSFNSNGFTVGSSDWGTGITVVDWCWDAGSTTSTNTSGSITSTISVNPTAGFSIVSYTGNGTAGATIGHSLGVAPKMIIVKNRITAGFDWVTYHQNMNASPQGGYLGLNATYAFQSNTTIWNNTAPSSSVFTLGTNTAVNKNGDNHIAYCFSEIEGYSKFGSYTGNGSADGPFVWCGFRPRWILIKRTDTTNDWEMIDTSRGAYNANTTVLASNLSSAESAFTTAYELDVLSNGFKPRSTGVVHNASGGTYIFAAFAESPFKYARAR